MSKIIAFQGRYGAYSDIACRTVFPEMETLPRPIFEDAISAVCNESADLAMIPIDNSIAGRVADIHYLLPKSGLFIIKEHFLPIEHCLLAPKGTKIDQLETIYSHVHALPQCRALIKELGLTPKAHGDTAQSAKLVAEMNDPKCAAIASSFAAEIYDLDILKHNIEDEKHNTTRFVVLSRNAEIPEYKEGEKFITSILFKLRSIPAALYKGLGGFATNNVNLTKLESYMVGGHFNAVEFLCDVEGHPEERSLQLALEELNFFAENVRMLGTYPASPDRRTKIKDQS